ncbi:MAG: epoxyqueuosine reductase, partial [Actinobacteria bacterium]|nr:epoxyqueuosine reductase [Actinomycetota bacterium]
LSIYTYITDLPCYESKALNKMMMMQTCVNCRYCVKNCPTGCINEDDFLINAEKCLTFFNENFEIFPVWIKENWHHAIVGCVKCQIICPENKGQMKEIIKGESFNKYETNLILHGEKLDDLPENTRAKLEKMCMNNYYEVIPGNLRRLINKKTSIS